MKKLIPVLMLFFLLLAPLCSGATPSVYTTDNIQCKTGTVQNITIYIDYSGKKAEFTFYDLNTEGISVDYSTNPVTTSTNTSITMQLTISPLLMPGPYELYPQWTYEVLGSSNGGGSSGGGSSGGGQVEQKDDPVEDTNNTDTGDEQDNQEEEDEQEQEQEEEDDNENQDQIDDNVDSESKDTTSPLEPWYPVIILIIAIVVSILIYIIWRKRKEKDT